MDGHDLVGARAPKSATTARQAQASRELGAAELPRHLRPDRLEVACGLTIDGEPHAAKLPAGAGRPRTAIEDAIRRALLRPPCLVSFSGGRDSSAVLATAAAVARREGLPLPVPITHRFPAVPSSREDGWQEELVAHLELPDWERLTVTAELDSVGPVAQAVLRRHGVVWPFNAHFHVPLFQRAAGGSFLTGVGGDELLGPQRWWAAQGVLAGHIRRRPRHVPTVALALAPRRVRQEVLARRRNLRWPWLHPEVDAALARRRAAAQARTPLRWDAALGWWWQSRRRAVVAETLRTLARDSETHLVQPFIEPVVLAAAGRRYGARGPASRSAAMRDLFADVLPESLLVRRSKASFDDAFFSEHSRGFVAEWSGEGVDTALVDVELARRTWHAVQPDPRSFSLLQAAWLARDISLNRRRADGTGQPTSRR